MFLLLYVVHWSSTSVLEIWDQKSSSWVYLELKLYGKPKALMLDVLFMVNQVHSLINAFLFKMGSFIQLWVCYFSYFWKFDCVSFSMHIQKLRLSLSVFQDFLPVLSFLASYLKRCFTDCLLLMYICNFFMLL